MQNHVLRMRALGSYCMQALTVTVKACMAHSTVQYSTVVHMLSLVLWVPDRLWSGVEEHLLRNELRRHHYDECVSDH